MTSRLLSPNERMIDVLDRASTMNFSTVARVRGEFGDDELRAALRKLEQRHPLLRAAIRHAGKRSGFVADRAAPIPLIVRQGAPDAWQALAEQSLTHRDWPDDGPRAELTCLRHGPRDATLLLCLQHVASDGTSGILAMRDLLSFLAGADLSSTAIASPGLPAFLPKSQRSLRTFVRALALIAHTVRGKPPHRLQRKSDAPFEQRRPRISRILIAREDSLAIARRAREARTTVHGVLCATVARAIAEQLKCPTRQRILHPVCLRRYLREYYPDLPSPGDAVGCYISSIDSDHLVDAQTELSHLAREISSQVRQQKNDGAPLLTTPIAGPLLADRFLHRPVHVLRKLAEDKVMLNTFSLTNLGRLENLCVREQIGRLSLDDLFFVAAGSVVSALGASATSFGGALSVQLVGVEPLIAGKQTRALCERVKMLLLEYAQGEEKLESRVEA